MRLDRSRARERHLLIGCRRDRTRFIALLTEHTRRSADLTSDIHIRILECHCPAVDLDRCGGRNGCADSAQCIRCGRRHRKLIRILRVQFIDRADFQRANSIDRAQIRAIHIDRVAEKDDRCRIRCSEAVNRPVEGERIARRRRVD